MSSWALCQGLLQLPWTDPPVQISNSLPRVSEKGSFSSESQTSAEVCDLSRQLKELAGLWHHEVSLVLGAAALTLFLWQGYAQKPARG